MATDNIQDFTDKMLSEKIFTCKVCKNLLVVPVMTVEGIGDVCHNCFETESRKYSWDNGVPNATLNTVLKELKFPCKFQPEGCDTVMLYDNLKQHEHACIYRPVDCVMDECDWTGKLIDLFKHFKEDHPKNVLHGPYEEFSFEMNVEKESSIIKLLNHRNRTCVLRIKKLEGDNSLVHFLQDITSTVEHLQMVVKYEGRDNVYKTKLEAIPFDATHDERSGKKIKLSTLKEVSQQDDIVKVVIKPENYEFKDANTDIIKNLECPVCKEVMRPPIFQCTTGHSMCKPCRARLTECPTCRNTFLEEDIRNFSLEALTPFVQYPCVYSQYGCLSTVLGSEIERHECNCNYQMFECPKYACKFKGSYSACHNHFKVNHTDDLITGTAYKSSFTPLGNRMGQTEQIVYFFEYGNIFKLVFSRLNDSCSWRLHLLNKSDISVQYSFTVRVADPRIAQKFIAKSSLCLGGAINTNDNIISFKYESLLPYKNTNNDEMNFCCEIFVGKSA